jgi:hypothetical protein
MEFIINERMKFSPIVILVPFYLILFECVPESWQIRLFGLKKKNKSKTKKEIDVSYHIVILIKEEKEPFCAGAMIGNRWIATAVHCLGEVICI